MEKTPFHKLYRTAESLAGTSSQKIDENYYSKELKELFAAQGFNNSLLTDSCTRALEIAAFCLNLSAADEVIIPAYGYVSTADVFAKTGAKLVFADSGKNHPNISVSSVLTLLKKNTKAIVVINYGGHAANIEELKALCDSKQICLIEDNAHGIGAKYNGKPLGSLGNISATSFHETKNVHCFSGGLLSLNNEHMIEQSIKYFNKGTDRHLFQKGSVDYYQWVSNGNSCEMSSLNKAFLYHQIQLLEDVNQQRFAIWNTYQKAFEGKEWNFIADRIRLDSKSKHNAHIYPICFKDAKQRLKIEQALQAHGIAAYTHYHSLNLTKFGKQYGTFQTPNANYFSNGLLRLPIYPGLDLKSQEFIIKCLLEHI